MIKDTMKRKKPSFNETYHGYRTFSELLEDAQKEGLLELDTDKRSRTYVVTRFGSEVERRRDRKRRRQKKRRRRPRRSNGRALVREYAIKPGSPGPLLPTAEEGPDRVPAESSPQEPLPRR